ncbi:MAG: hypothetical protein ABSD31_11240 [Candidatus Binataceae bacterium]|jgi:hypothetical protein
MRSLKGTASLALVGLIVCLATPAYVAAQTTGEYGTSIDTGH